jgi:hypothetical protein
LQCCVIGRSIDVDQAALSGHRHVDNVRVEPAEYRLGAGVERRPPELVEEQTIEQHRVAVSIANRRTDDRRVRPPPRVDNGRDRRRVDHRHVDEGDQQGLDGRSNPRVHPDPQGGQLSPRRIRVANQPRRWVRALRPYGGGDRIVVRAGHDDDIADAGRDESLDDADDE